MLNAVVFPCVCQERDVDFPPFSAQGLGPDILLCVEVCLSGGE